jgi:hypothetical protein
MIELTSEFVEQYAAADEREKLHISREPTGAQRGKLGFLLFDREETIIKVEIKRQMPQASDAFVMDVLRMAIRMIHAQD